MKARRNIEVEELEPLTREGLDDLERWNAYGRRLKARDPARFRRMLALAWSYVAIYDDPDESEDAFEARLRLATGAMGRGGLS